MKFYHLLILIFTANSLVIGQDTLSLFNYLHQTGDTIRFDFETNQRGLNRLKKKKKYQPLNLRITVGDSTLTFPGKIRARGNARLNLCANPSLKVKLKKAPLLAAGFSDLNEFKIVQQCSDGRTGLSYLRREHLAYQLHAIYSEHSHRTIPLHLRQRPDDDEDELKMGFIIEEEEQLAARYGGRISEAKQASTSGLDRSSYVNMCLFNYLILNTDWNVFNLHNVEILSRNGQARLIAIPYDFDYSGFVGTSYSVPNEGLDIKSVQQPKWLGRKVTLVEVETAAAHFLAKAEQARKLIEEHPDLSDYTRKRLLHRLDSFNKEIANPNKLKRLANAKSTAN